MCDRGRSYPGGLEIGFYSTVVVVEVVESGLHCFGAAVHPDWALDGVALGLALLFKPDGVRGFEEGLAEGVVFDYYVTRHASQR